MSNPVKNLFSDRKIVGLEKGDQDMKIYFGSFLYPISFSPFFHREAKIISMIDLDVGSI